MTSFGTILDRHRGVGPGFDFMRLALATAVMVFHAFQLTVGRYFSAGPLEVVVLMTVPAFFALSGFLVMGSLLRLGDIPRFLLFRVLRIGPALLTVTLFAALVLGPLTTTLPLADYVADPSFGRYLLNAVGLFYERLPGVFLDNPLSGIVNGQLWTVPPELSCYLMLALLALLRLAPLRWFMLGLFLTLAVAETVVSLLPGHVHSAAVLHSREMLVLCFLCGSVFYLWRDRIPASAALLVGSSLAFVCVTYWFPPLAFLLGTTAAAYFVTYLGLRPMPHVPVLMNGDLSYGIYLYSFPIQQAVIWALPGDSVWYLNLAVAGPITILLASLSWHWIEKPALGLRKLLAPRAVLVSP